MKHIYQCMKESHIKDSTGNNYPDVLTCGISDFNVNSGYLYYTLLETDINRFDLLMNFFYNTTDYDDIILMLNGVYKNDLQVGDIIIIPNLDNINSFFERNKKITRKT